MVVSVPKSDSCSTSALALSVRLPSALKSRLRREIGRSRLTDAVPLVRPSELPVADAERGAALLSRCDGAAADASAWRWRRRREA